MKMQHQTIPIIDQNGELSLEAMSVFANDLSDPPCVFVGSGISIWPPTDLPSGQGFTQAMFSLLFEGLDFEPHERDLLAEMFGVKDSLRFSGMPFEHLMECCPSEDKAMALINLLYESTRVNALHRALAQRLKDRKIHAIITTNYDCCLDRAIEEEGFACEKVAVESQARVAAECGSLPCYFKVHGSIEKGLEKTPMYSLKHEGLLHPDKRRLLSRLVTDRSLVMIGYSGLDFELCPELERLQFKRLIWNSRKNTYPSTSARRLIENTGGILLFGDMRLLFQHWLGCEVSALPADLPKRSHDQREAGLKTLRDAVQKIFFNEREIRLWGIRVLNSLGAPCQATRMLARLSPASDRFLAAIESGRAAFHAGRYKKARRSYQRALLLALVSGNRLRAGDAALELSDAYRTFGSLVRGYVCTKFVELLFLKSLTAKKLLKQSLVVKNILEISSSAKSMFANHMGDYFPAVNRHWTAFHSWAEVRLTKKIVECGRYAQLSGNWIDFQQLALVAEETGVDISGLASGDYYVPPPAAEGYRHLGYYIPQTMIFFTNCRLDKRLLGTRLGHIEWRHHKTTCKRLGVNSSLWKILALSSSSKTRRIARQVFDRCEYSYLKGLLDWKKFSGEWRIVGVQKPEFCVGLRQWRRRTPKT